MKSTLPIKLFFQLYGLSKLSLFFQFFRYNPPPEKPLTDLDVKYEDQPRAWLDEDLSLHPYQLEGISWARHSWNNGTDIILADEMGLGKTIQVMTML